MPRHYYLGKNKNDVTEEVGDYQFNEKNNMSLMKWLDGKKTIIAGVITTVASFLVLKGVIDANSGTFISAITTIIFGSAAVVGKSMRDQGSL